MSLGEVGEGRGREEEKDDEREGWRMREVVNAKVRKALRSCNAMVAVELSRMVGWSTTCLLKVRKLDLLIALNCSIFKV